MTTSPSKTVKRTLRQDLEYVIEGTAWTLRADFGPILNDDNSIEMPGVLTYLMPDDKAAQLPPNETNCEQYVFAALPEKQRKKFAKATIDGSFPSYYVLDAAVTAWKNTMGWSEIESVVERTKELNKERMDLMLEHVAALKAAETEAEFEEALKSQLQPKPKAEADTVDPTED